MIPSRPTRVGSRFDGELLGRGKSRNQHEPHQQRTTGSTERTETQGPGRADVSRDHGGTAAADLGPSSQQQRPGAPDGKPRARLYRCASESVHTAPQRRLPAALGQSGTRAASMAIQRLFMAARNSIDPERRRALDCLLAPQPVDDHHRAPRAWLSNPSPAWSCASAPGTSDTHRTQRARDSPLTASPTLPPSSANDASDTTSPPAARL